MKILQVISSSNIGGAENYVVNLSKKLMERGHEVFIIASNNKSFKEFLKKNGLAYITVNMVVKFNLLSILKIAAFARKNGIDIIHTNLSKANFMGAIAAKIINIPSISTAHGLNKKTQYIFSDKIICVSRAVMDNLVSQGMNSEKLFKIYNGIDIKKFDPDNLKQKDILNNDVDLNIGIIARLSPEKGVNFFIAAAVLILKETNKIKFFVAGTGKQKDELIGLSKDLGIESFVHFLGFVEEKMTSFLNELDILIFPSIKEGMPLSLLEVMAMKKAVIVSKAGGMPEVVEDGKNGFVVDIGDTIAIKNAVMRFLEDRQLVLKMGEEARKTILGNFTVDLMTSNVEKLYERTIDKRI